MVLKKGLGKEVPKTPKEVPAVPKSGAENEQVIIEVAQEEIKVALRNLLVTQSDLLALLYNKFDEYNQLYFGGLLSMPLITVEKLSHRTFGQYTYGQNNIHVKNHIRLNRNFVALNNEDRILESLRHEMIHQWQDEVLYAEEGATTFKTFKQATLDEADRLVYVTAEQKKRPKEWHNNDFREMAKVVDIPANGPKCSGSPAKMPEPKSYNRKFVCKCPTSNEYPVTIWSTREIHATCNDCGQPFIEVEKHNPKAITIKVKTSHVEQPGQDAVQIDMLQRFKHFSRFATKKELNAFIARIPETSPGYRVIEHGVYQKGHNAYNLPEAYRYWVAYDDVNPPAAAKPSGKPNTTPTAKTPVTASQPPKKATAKGKESNVLAFPGGGVADKAPNARVWNSERAQDVLDAYLETGSISGASKLLGITTARYKALVTKHGIDFSTKKIGAHENRKGDPS